MRTLLKVICNAILHFFYPYDYIRIKTMNLL